MRVRGFHHLAIQVRDLLRTSAFYQEVLGLPEQARYHRPDGTLRSIWIGLPDGFLALEECEAPPRATPFRDPTPGLHLLALRISPEERAAAVRELEARGVEVLHQTRWTLYFRDPEGNRIALSHHPEDSIE